MKNTNNKTYNFIAEALVNSLESRRVGDFMNSFDKIGGGVSIAVVDGGASKSNELKITFSAPTNSLTHKFENEDYDRQEVEIFFSDLIKKKKVLDKFEAELMSAIDQTVKKFNLK